MFKLIVCGVSSCRVVSGSSGGAGVVPGSGLADSGGHGVVPGSGDLSNNSGGTWRTRLSRSGS